MKINEMLDYDHTIYNVDGNLVWCDKNNLTSLEGCPDIGSETMFSCSHNMLKTLEGGPKSVAGSYYCGYNRLTSLEGGPTSVGRIFDCTANQLTSLEHAPSIVGMDFICNFNNITSLVGVDDIFSSLGSFRGDTNPILEGGLGLLLIDKISEIDIDLKPFYIIKRYVNKGPESVYDCQQELIEAGFEEFAQI